MNGAGWQFHVDVARLHHVSETGKSVQIKPGALGGARADVGDADLAQRIVERGSGGVQPPYPDFAILLESRLAAIEGGFVLAAVLVGRASPALVAGGGLIAPLLGPDTPVAFIMNGSPWWYFDGIGGALEGKRLAVLDPNDALRRAIGVERAIGGVIYAASAVVAPGIVTSEHADLKLFLGEPGGAVSPRAQALAAMLSAGGMPTDAVGNIRHRIWGKLLGNMVVGPLCLLSRQDMKATLSDPAIFEAGIRISDEGTALARALGHDLKVPGEVRMRRFGETAHKPSILQDLELGRPMEIDALFIAPLQLSQALGVPMPNFALMVALATQAAQAAGLFRL